MRKLWTSLPACTWWTAYIISAAQAHIIPAILLHTAFSTTSTYQSTQTGKQSAPFAVLCGAALVQVLRSQSLSPGLSSSKGAANGQLAASPDAADSHAALSANAARELETFTCDAPRHGNSAAAAGIGHLSRPAAASAAVHASLDVLGRNAAEQAEADLKALATSAADVRDNVTNRDNDMQELGPLSWTAVARLNWRLCVAVCVLYACTLSIFPGFWQVRSALLFGHPTRHCSLSVVLLLPGTGGEQTGHIAACSCAWS
jgi:hypothetical protein